ncbi:MAG: RNA-binding S4 domain-containing protein [Candidatus Altiarchaeota archaeon]|nr:RNA-binding S4 domain-containing protein [Candidatus Altiarchaeota archaeon]
METFRFSGDYIELNRLLKASDLCDTGGRANRAIEEGLVIVDGIVEYRKRHKIRDGQTVACGAAGSGRSVPRPVRQRIEGENSRMDACTRILFYCKERIPSCDIVTVTWHGRIYIYSYQFPQSELVY